MEIKLIFPLVIHPNQTKNEKILILFLISFIFIPFAYGIFVQKILYCLSLPIGLIGLLAFNYFTKYKFTTLKIIQKEKFVEFTNNELKIYENNDRILYNWNELESIEINLISYKNKRKDEDWNFNGIENYISFIFNNSMYKYFFYINTSKEYNNLSEYFKKNILLKLYELKNIKTENIIISNLDYPELQEFKIKYNINRFTDFIHYD